MPLLLAQIAEPAALILAEEDSTLFLGEDFFPWMVLAFGAAMVVGNVLALFRPPADTDADTDADTGDRPTKPPVTRAVVLIVVGLAASAWGLASLLA